MISDFQYERLCWLIENKDLDERDLRIISSMLFTFTWSNEQQEDGAIRWLLQWLRGKPHKKLPPPWDNLCL